MSGISGNFSEKRKRGRPSAMEPTVEAGFRASGLFGQYRTRRGAVNKYYGIVALDALKDEAGLTWLFTYDDMRRGGNCKVRYTILSELGRLRDPEMIRGLAAQLCELKPTTTAAVAKIRRFRTGKQAQASADDLADRLCNVLGAYEEAHADATHAMMRDALAQALQVVNVAGASERGTEAA